MKNKTKRAITILAVIVLLLNLVACSGKTFKCAICNEEKTGKSYKSQQMGEEITICEDCYKDINEFTGN